jgi:hypothetical protein
METYSTRMWMLSSTLGTGTSSHGGCCCHREFPAPLSVVLAMNRFESWDAKAQFHLAAQSRPAQVGCHFAPSFTSLASAYGGVHRNEPFVVAFAARLLSHASAVTVRLRFPSSVPVLAASRRSGHSTSCRTRHGRLIMTEKSGLSDFDLQADHAQAEVRRRTAGLKRCCVSAK